MRIRRTISLLLAIAVPLEAWEAAPAPRDTVARTTTALCRELTASTKAIESLLLTVTDTTTAEAAAPQIRAQQERVRELLAHLEHAPADSQTGQEIMQAMMTITHISQRFLPLITYLQAQNAYGSAQLAAVLRDHEGAGDAETVFPHTMVYEDMCSLAGELLYILRKTTDAYTARAATLAIRRGLTRQQALAEKLQELQPPPPEAATQLQQVHRRLRELHAELAAEAARLSQATYYAEPELHDTLAEYATALQNAHATH